MHVRLAIDEMHLVEQHDGTVELVKVSMSHARLIHFDNHVAKHGQQLEH